MKKVIPKIIREAVRDLGELDVDTLLLNPAADEHISPQPTRNAEIAVYRVNEATNQIGLFEAPGEAHWNQLQTLLKRTVKRLSVRWRQADFRSRAGLVAGTVLGIWILIAIPVGTNDTDAIAGVLGTEDMGATAVQEMHALQAELAAATAARDLSEARSSALEIASDERNKQWALEQANIRTQLRAVQNALNERFRNSLNQRNTAHSARADFRPHHLPKTSG